MKIVIISGPTASGKSSLALKFGSCKNAAIINADSLQIYEGLPTLSSQPSLIEKKTLPHFLYSHFKYNESCSVGLWLKLVESLIKQQLENNKIPIIVGGSGMYISKLVDGISEIPEIEPIFRAHATELFEEIGREKFIQNLTNLGENIEQIKNLDKQRLTRVLEVLLQTNKSIFWWQNQPKKKLFEEKKFLHINLNLDREKIYQNCDLRLQKMLENGAIEEVATLLKQNLEPNLQITKTIGFLEIKSFLNNEISKKEMNERISQKTKNYAKRQLTWFRHQTQDKISFFDNAKALTFLQNEI